MGDPDPVVGRSRELGELRRWYDEALAGTGRLALVVGEPGIGKTRLVEEFAREAVAEGATVAWGHAVDDVNAPALRPWRRLLRTLPAASPSDWFGFADAVTDALVEAGGVFVLEDLQWADSASLRLLRHVARELGRSQVLFVATYRDTHTDTASPLAEMLPALLREPRVEVLRPGLLERDDVLEVLFSLTDEVVDPAYVDLLHQRTGGNPLYVRTLARLLAAAGSLREYDASRVGALVSQRPELRQLVAALLSSMTAEQRAVLAAASVLGERIDPALLTDVVQSTALPTVQAGVAAGLLVEVDGWRFTHALLRDGVYAGIDAGQRGALHQRAAHVLTGRGADAAEIAGHWVRAADPAHLADISEWARRAGREALDASAHEEAIRWASTALDALERSSAPDNRVAEVLLEQATAEYAAGYVRRAMDHALAAVDRDPTNALNVAAAALVVQGISEKDVAREAATLCGRALAVLPVDTEPALRARLLAQLTCMAPEADDREAWSAAALRLAEQTGDTDAVFESLRARQMVMSAPEHVDERIALGQQAVQLGRWPAAWGHIWLVEAALQLGDTARVDSELETLAAVAARLRSPLAHWHHARLTAARMALVGEFDDALAINDRAHELAVRMEEPSAAAMSHAFRLRTAVTRGKPDDIDDELLAARRAAPQMIIVATSQVFALRVKGQYDEAAAKYAELRGLAASVPDTGGWLPAMRDLGELAVLFGDREEAAVMYDVLVPHVAYFGTETIGTVQSGGSLALQVGGLAALLGRTDEAERQLRAAIDANDRAGAQPFAAIARMRLAELIADRAPAVALGLLQHAARTLRRLDMPGPLAECEALVARLQAGDGPLTRREREVAGLVADGLSNRDIADKLVLSEPTVESHVANILTKLQCSSRTQIATWALRQGPPALLS